MTVHALRAIAPLRKAGAFLSGACFRKIAVGGAAAVLSVSCWCSSSVDSVDHERNLARSLPSLAEPDSASQDSQFILNENQLELEHSTDIGIWSAAFAFADPNAYVVEGNYGFTLSHRRARGLHFAYGQHRQEIVLSEAFSLGRTTMLRLMLGHAREADELGGDRSAEPSVRQIRAVEAKRWMAIGTHALVATLAAHGGETMSYVQELTDGMPSLLEPASPDTLASPRQGAAATLSFVPRTQAFRVDVGLARQKYEDLDGHDGRFSTNIYYLRAAKTLRQCRSLDIEFRRSEGHHDFAVLFNTQGWRLGLTTAQAAGQSRPDMAVMVAVELPLDQKEHVATCEERQPIQLERRDLIDAVRVSPVSFSLIRHSQSTA